MNASQPTEIRILSTIRIKENWFKYKPVLQMGFFSSEETRQLFKIIEGFFNKYENEKMTTKSMSLMVNLRIKDEELKSSCIELIRKIRRQDSTDSKVVEETIKQFAKTQLIKLSITEALALLDKPHQDLTTVKEYIDRALTLNTEGEGDIYNYFDDPVKRLKEEAQEKRISTGIAKLDEALDGGMSPGELLVFLGPPGRGKTTALINLGMGGLLQGLKVCHITLEISDRKIARRYDMRISGKTFNTLRAEPEKVKNPLSRLKAKGCNLVIKDYSMEAPKVEDIYGMILNYQSRTNEAFDLVVIDYGDLIASNHNYKEGHTGPAEVYTELRRMARKLAVPVYTASQATREALSKHTVTMKDTADSFGKVKVADVVIGICQTPEEEEEKLVRLFIAKSRKASGHPSIRLEMDTDKMYLGELRNERTES